jgi:hypothetical protein
MYTIRCCVGKHYLVFCQCFTAAMSEDALIRLNNLLSLKLGATELSDRVGGRYTYWRDLLSGNKSFGEKIARKAEEKLGLPRGWLDKGGDLPSLAEKESVGGLSPAAYELARLFDLLPHDRIKRTVAYNAATEAILKVLQQHDALPNPGPTSTDAAKKQRA